MTRAPAPNLALSARLDLAARLELAERRLADRCDPSIVKGIADSIVRRQRNA